MDLRLHRLVDCLCEVDYVIVPSKDKSADAELKKLPIQELLGCAEYRAKLRPMFRVTVGWMVEQQLLSARDDPVKASSLG